MEKKKKLQKVQSCLLKLSSFLQDYLPLANAHNTDFIAYNLLDQLVPKLIQEELANLSETQLADLSKGYITEDHQSLEYNEATGKLTSEGNIIEVRENYDDKFITGAGNGRQLQCETDNVNSETHLKWNHNNLVSFISTAHKHSLGKLEILCDIDELISGTSTTKDRLQVTALMSPQKSHEVDVMAYVCAELASICNVIKVIDIGSGRGYLSSQLALQYGLRVIGIDSSSTNTRSAVQRGKHLNKQWNGLLRNAIEDSQLEEKIKRGKNYRGRLTKKQRKKQNMVAELQAVNDEPESSLNVEGVENVDLLPSLFTDMVFEDTQDSGEIIRAEIDERLVSTNMRGSQESDAKSETRSADSRRQTKKSKDKAKCKESKSGNVPYIPLTEYISDSTDISNLLLRANSSESPDSDAATCESDLGHEINKLMLTGLHTCGNLAPVMLRLFVANETAEVLCNVGCCYHLVEEKYAENPFKPGEAAQDVGFPMSVFLTDRKMALGRNARMLAAQAPERLAEKQKISNRSLYYRALLQVILRDLTGENSKDWHVGKMAAKCETFVEYVQKCLVKLNIPHDQLSEARIVEYKQQYGGYEAKLAAFFALRTTLASCIEAVIMLDRLCYLLEQDCVEDAWLTQLFDPLQSPRCFGIIARKTVKI